MYFNVVRLALITINSKKRNIRHYRLDIVLHRGR